jgi:hypothetical protein
MKKAETTTGKVIDIPENLPEGLKFLYGKINNFKGKGGVVELNIDGKSFFVLGNNEAGKSSLIQAMQSAISVDALPPEPVHVGADSSQFHFILGGMVDGQRQVISVEGHFKPGTTRDQTPSQILKGSYVVKNESGEDLPKTKESLQHLFGKIFLDPWEFQKLDRLGSAGKKQMVEILKDLSGCKVEVDLLFKKKDGLTKEKSVLNAIIKSDEAIMDDFSKKFTKEDIAKYKSEADISSIQKEMEEVSKKAQEYNRIKDGIESFKKELLSKQKECTDIDSVVIPLREQEKKRLQSEIARLRDEILRIEGTIEGEQEKIISATNLKADIIDNQIPEIEKKITKGSSWLEKTPEPTIEEVSNKMTEAQLHNKRYQEIQEMSKMALKIRNNKEAFAKKDAELRSVKSEVDSVIEKSQIPVKGLTFDEGDVYYEGLPFGDNQLNKAMYGKIGVNIAMAMKPKTKVIFIEDAGNFDKAYTKAILDEAEAKGFQVIFEKPVWDGTDFEYQFSEEFMK